MVLCDIENHDDSAILPLKGKLVSDLLELGKVDGLSHCVCVCY